MRDVSRMDVKWMQGCLVTLRCRIGTSSQPVLQKASGFIIHENRQWKANKTSFHNPTTFWLVRLQF